MYRWCSRYALAAMLFGTLGLGCGAFGDPPGASPTTSTTPSEESAVPLPAPVTEPEPVSTLPPGTEPAPGEPAPGESVPSTVLLRADLSGSAVAGGGDPDGSGRALITSDSHGDEVCFSLMATGLEPVSSLHVHEGGAGATGPVLVDLTRPGTNSERGCLSLPETTLTRLAAAPSGFYVDVHTPAHPDGAVRGQLSA